MNSEYADQILAGEIITLNGVITREFSGYLVSSIDAILAKQRQTIEKLPNSESYANLALNPFLYDKKFLKVICNEKILRLVEIILGVNYIRSFMKSRFDYVAMVDPETRKTLSELEKRILGYHTIPRRSLEELFVDEKDRLYKSNQG